jgi:hypothetical protein
VRVGFRVADELGLDRAGLGAILRNGSGRSYGIEVFLGSGSLAAMVDSPIRPTLTKDVGLLVALTRDLAAGAILRQPAQTFVNELDRAARA